MQPERHRSYPRDHLRSKPGGEPGLERPALITLRPPALLARTDGTASGLVALQAFRGPDHLSLCRAALGANGRDQRHPLITRCREVLRDRGAPRPTGGGFEGEPAQGTGPGAHQAPFCAAF